VLPSLGGASPVVDDDGVTFSLVDRNGRLVSVRLVDELGLDGPFEMERVLGEWRLRLTRPGVDRMEYLFEIEDRRGNRATITDPANPRRAAGAFGDKSVALFPGYREPAWVTLPGGEHVVEPLIVDAPPLGAAVTGTLWAPASLTAGEAAPLLVVHDGPEYAALGGFTHYLGASIAAGSLPPLRAALLGPGERDAWYSANPAYARVLADRVLPALDEMAPATARIGAGVSLGALALLHAQRSYPDAFDALLLQSGSFFTLGLDPQEKDFSGFAAVSAFVAELHAAGAAAPAARSPSGLGIDPVPAILTCGIAEENLANNRLMTATLQRLGYQATLVEARDAHNYTAWRDCLDPHLVTLVTSLVGGRAA
jgi:enterochelin esterase-like enzyme